MKRIFIGKTVNLFKWEVWEKLDILKKKWSAVLQEGNQPR